MIKVICVGKIKESFYREAILEYLKRIQKYHKLEIIEVMDSTVKQERELILKKIDKRDYIITLEIEGKQIDSLEFSELIDKTFLNYSNITFIIGGSLGLTEDLLNKCDFKICFSKMTFPHQLIRIFLLEQIFRGFKISNGETYHR